VEYTLDAFSSSEERDPWRIGFLLLSLLSKDTRDTLI
jgi:hypothetical protein